MKKLMILLIMVGLLLSACGGSAIEEAAAEEEAQAATEVPAADEPEEEAEEPAAEPVTVKIGVLNPQTGGLAAFGADVDRGIDMYFANGDYMIGDNITVELQYADTAASPEQALEQARRLVEQENVDLLLGIVSSSVAVPLAQYADESETPLVVTVAGGTPVITGPDRSPYVFRTSITTGQLEPILGWYTATELGYQTAVVMAPDFSAGHSRAESFKAAFEGAGGEVIAEIFPARGTTDFGPFIGQFDPDDIDVIYAYFFGSEAVAFVQQLNEFGVTPGKPVVSPGFLTEAEVLPAMGDSSLGIISGAHYAPVLDTAANADFVALNDNNPPGTYLESGFLGAQIVAEAIATVGGDFSDTQAFLDALAATQAAVPSGDFSFDARGQSVRSLYIIQVVKADDGSYTHEVLDEIEGVTQDWTP